MALSRVAIAKKIYPPYLIREKQAGGFLFMLKYRYETENKGSGINPKGRGVSVVEEGNGESGGGGKIRVTEWEDRVR